MSSSNMSDKVRAISKVSLPSSTLQPHAPRQQTGATPGGSNAMSGRVRPSTKVAIPAPEVRGHAPPVPYSHTREQVGPTAGANPGKHASAPILGDLAKLTPALAAGIRKAAAAK
jgi:hypothetical protein